MKYRIPCWALILILCLSLTPAAGEEGGYKLVVTVHAVGHGDMIEIRDPVGEITLVDCGDAASPAARRAVTLLPSRITRFIATHAHDDHIGNARLILTKTGSIFDSGLEYATRTQEELFRGAAQGCTFTILGRGDRIKLGGDAWLDVLSPPRPLLRGTASDANNNSVVLMLGYRDFRLLLTGDIEMEGLDELVSSGPNLRCTAVKIPHHGSRGSLHKNFIAQTKARWAIASCGVDGDPKGHGLPHEDCLSAWRKSGAEVYTTGRHGSLRISSDGKNHRLDILPSS